MMHLPTRKQAGVVVAAVSGRIDHATSEAFNRALDPLLEDCRANGNALLLDFSDVPYISSAGLRVLMVASRQAKGQAGRFALAALTPLVREVFTISRFNLIVPCYATVDQGCEALAG